MRKIATWLMAAGLLAMESALASPEFAFYWQTPLDNDGHHRAPSYGMRFGDIEEKRPTVDFQFGRNGLEVLKLRGRNVLRPLFSEELDLEDWFRAGPESDFDLEARPRLLPRE